VLRETNRAGCRRECFSGAGVMFTAVARSRVGRPQVERPEIRSKVARRPDREGSVAERLCR
jgi:hypothetical protein